MTARGSSQGESCFPAGEARLSHKSKKKGRQTREGGGEKTDKRRGGENRFYNSDFDMRLD